MGYSRNEEILENMLGEQDELLEPQSRIEVLLHRILQKGGTGGGGTLVASDDGNGTITLDVR